MFCSCTQDNIKIRIKIYKIQYIFNAQADF